MNGKLNMMKGAIETATRVSTVSPSYAAEIKDPWFSWGLHDELNLRHYKLCGIKNGMTQKATIRNRLSALSQLFKGRYERQGRM